MTQTPSFRRSSDQDKSNKFCQMQELTNDYYSVIKLHNIFHIAYNAIELSTNKKEPTNRLMHEFSRERQPLHCDVIIGKHYFLIKLHRVFCTHYFMSIHNLQCRVNLNKIGKRDNKKSLKNTLYSIILALKSTLYAS